MVQVRYIDHYDSQWKHWGCVSTRVFNNIKAHFHKASDLDGYEDLKPEDQKKLDTAYEAGHVADEDIPESARKPVGDEGADDDEDEKPKKKKAAPKKKKAADDGDEEEEEKPKKARASRAKVCHFS